MFWARLPPRFEAAVVDVRSSRPEFRLEAVVALGRETGPRRDAAVRAVGSCVRDEVAAIRAAVAQSLSTLGGDEAASDLEALVDDPHPSVREAAAEGLSAYPGAAPLLATSRHPEVRFQAALGLAQAGLSSADATALLTALLGDPDARVRGAAVDALSELGATRDAAVRDALASALTDADPGTRDAAAIALARAGDPRCAEALAAALEARATVDAAVAARALVELPRVRAALQTAARGRAPRLARFTALAALASRGDRAAEATLARALRSWFPSRRLDALHVVGEARVSTLVPILVQAARAGRPFDDDTLAHALERFEADPRAHEGLAALDARR